MKIDFILNGKNVSAEISPEMSLLTVLKDVLHVTSVKRACIRGECGACTVIIDGKSMNSCLTLAATMDGKSVDTVESLGTPENLHPIQQAFYDTGAFQCGFCTPGFIMSAKALLDNNPNPTKDEIRRGLSGNLCRCTGYIKPMEAVNVAAEYLKASDIAVDAVADAAKRLNTGASNQEVVKDV